MTTPSIRYPTSRRPQRGASLIFALLALVVISLAAVALVRSVDTGALVIGNLGFKVETTAASDRGAEAAITWMQAQLAGAGLDNDITASGYYATSLDALDATGRNTAAATRAVVDWAGDGCASVSGAFSACLTPSASTTVNGVSWRYLITRLCATAGDSRAAGNSCVALPTGAGVEDSNSGSLDYSNPAGFDATLVSTYYRIVVRAAGGRNTVSYTETIMHF